MRSTTIAAVAALTITACNGEADTGTIPQPTRTGGGRPGQAARWCREKRIDIERPTFSNPTKITNPLFPITELVAARWSHRRGLTATLPLRDDAAPGHGYGRSTGRAGRGGALSQYTAYLDGRIKEVALDRYAQADDGSVWYLGEDVYDYDGAPARRRRRRERGSAGATARRR